MAVLGRLASPRCELGDVLLRLFAAASRDGPLGEPLEGGTGLDGKIAPFLHISSCPNLPLFAFLGCGQNDLFQRIRRREKGFV